MQVISSLITKRKKSLNIAIFCILKIIWLRFLFYVLYEVTLQLFAVTTVPFCIPPHTLFYSQPDVGFHSSRDFKLKANTVRSVKKVVSDRDASVFDPFSSPQCQNCATFN